MFHIASKIDKPHERRYINFFYIRYKAKGGERECSALNAASGLVPVISRQPHGCEKKKNVEITTWGGRGEGKGREKGGRGRVGGFVSVW